MAGSRTLKVSILADVAELTKGLNSGSKDVQTFGDKVSDFGKKAGAAFLAAGAAAAAYAGKLAIDGVKAAVADEAAQAKLAATLENVTGATDNAVAATEAFILQTSLATGSTDDELRPALERLVRSTKDVKQAQDLLTLALDVSKGSGKGLETVANALGKAFEGQTTALGKLGVGISATELKTMTFTEITQRLSDTFGGQAAIQADTFAGKLARMRVAFDEAKETVGGFILDALQPLIDLFVNNVFPALSKMSSGLGDDGILGRFKAVGKYLVDIFSPLWDGLKSAFDKVSDAIKRNKDDFQPLIDTFKTLYDFIKNTLIPAGLQVMGNTFSALGTIIAKVIDAVSGAVNFVAKGIQFAVNAAISGINLLIKAYNAIPFLDDVKALSGVSFASQTFIGNPNLQSVVVPTMPTTGGGGGSAGGGGGSAGGGKADPAAAKLQETMDDLRVTQYSVSETLKKLDQIAAKQLTAMEFYDRASTPPTINFNAPVVSDPETLARLVADNLNNSANRTGNYATLGISTTTLPAAAL